MNEFGKIVITTDSASESKKKIIQAAVDKFRQDAKETLLQCYLDALDIEISPPLILTPEIKAASERAKDKAMRDLVNTPSRSHSHARAK